MNVLVTALGTVSGTAIAKRLKNNKDMIIFGADINESDLIYASKEVDTYTQFPTAVNNENYLDFLIDFCKKNKIDVIIPIIDEEVELLTNNQTLFSSLNVKIITAGKKTVDICRDKLITFSYIKDKFPEIYIPTVSLINFQNQFNLPAFVKPNKGRASIDCSRINDEWELEYYKRKKDVLSELIIQPFCEGEIVSVDLIRSSKDDQAKVAIRKELLRNKNGAAIAVEFIENKKLEEICFSIAKDLDVDGVVNFEFFVNNDGYKLIEINPRFPAGTEFTCLAGLDLINDALRIKIGDHMSNSTVIVGKKFVRRYETYEVI